MTQRAHDIVLTGQGKWCALIADGLKEYADLEVSVAPFDSALDAFKLERWSAVRRARLVVRVGFRPGARTWRGRGIDSAFRAIRKTRPGLRRSDTSHPGQRTAYYWIGTDVQRMLEDVASGVAPSWLAEELRTAHHASVAATSLTEELLSVGVEAETIPLPYKNIPRDDSVAPLPAEFAVLTYIPDARASFYGALAILDAARRLPEVRFFVLGGKGANGLAAPDNVEYLGWQEDSAQWYERASCLVRLVEHDGGAGTVVEALAYGRPAIYSRKQPHVIHVPFGDADALTGALQGLLARHRAGELRADDALALEIRAAYAPEHCFPAFAAWLRRAAAESRERERAPATGTARR